MADTMCEGKRRLLVAHDHAKAAYESIMDQLRALRLILSADGYRKLGEIAEEARLKVEQTRAEIDRHIAEHDC